MAAAPFLTGLLVARSPSRGFAVLFGGVPRFFSCETIIANAVRAPPHLFAKS
jgi:hypothetical protein